MTLVPGGKIVKCSVCGRGMKPSKWLRTFDCKIEFPDISLKLPVGVLEDFLVEDNLTTYGDNTNDLLEKLLYLENVDFTYDNKNVITAIEYH